MELSVAFLIAVLVLIIWCKNCQYSEKILSRLRFEGGSVDNNTKPAKDESSKTTKDESSKNGNPQNVFDGKSTCMFPGYPANIRVACGPEGNVCYPAGTSDMSIQSNSSNLGQYYDVISSSVPKITGFGINSVVDPAVNAALTGQPNISYPYPPNYDGGRLVRNARDFPAYGQPMPDKYEFGRMFYAEYPEISYKPGFW